MVLPTYNHAGSLRGVLARLAALQLPVIVIDDGSTDETAELLATCRHEFSQDARFGSLTVLTHEHNRGKAAALHTGFAHAVAAGATHVATIDADGQLDPEDIPALLREAELHPRALILGSRPENMEHCPPRCRVGRRNASLAVLAETGLRLSDTQCGLRVYPLELIATVRCRASHYAFEAEIVTRAAWAGFELREVRVNCRYFPPPERVSHWKPWRDSLRQGSVHVRLVACALMPWTPRASTPDDPDTGVPAFRKLLRWLNPLRSWREVRMQATGDIELASGLAIGAWIGTLPFFGFHTLISVFVAWRLHLQPAAVVLGSQVSAPPFGIALAVASIAIGHFLLTGELLRVEPAALTWSTVWRIPFRLFADWMLGSMLLGIAVGAVAYALGLWIARRARRSAQTLSPDA